MTNSTFKKAIAATIAVATLAAASTTTAQAGSKDFWRGAAAGAVAGVVTGAIVSHNRRNRDVVYVERRRAPRTVYVERHVTPVADGHAWNDAQHTRWCLNRYNSYNPRTDMYLSFSGRYKYCSSPYSG